MKIAILTSSRADFGIYYPLINELWNDDFFQAEIIAFGTHLKEEFGNTINEILKSGFNVKYKIETSTKNKGAIDISESIGDAVTKFSKFWNTYTFDLVIALGDRYEMFAAVAAASPYNIDIAHIHAGETTLGAIDNAYRHSISLMSKYLFVSTEEYKKRAIEIIKETDNVFNVGALSVDNLYNQKLYATKEFIELFKTDITKPTILSTFHPETVSFEKNEDYIEELIKTFEVLKDKYQIIITMPNSDTTADMIREKIHIFAMKNKNVILVESFGMKAYLTCMKYASMLIGNTSSGFVEAAFFPKWVINIGDRQKGRIVTNNIINCTIEKGQIIEAVRKAENTKLPLNTNIYGEGNTSKKIVSIIKSLYEHR